MAGGEHLNMVEYPPLPSVHQNQNNKQPFSSSKSPDRDKTFSNNKVLTSANSSPFNRDSFDLVVGSIFIPPIPSTFEPQITKPSDLNRVSSPNPKSPTILLDSQKAFNPQLRSEAVGDHSQQSKEYKKDDKVNMSNLAKAYMCNLDLHPCHHIQGKPCVSFSMEEKQSLLHSMNFIVVIKFSHFRPKFHVLNSFLMNMGFLGNFRIMEFDNKHIFVEFRVFEDFCKLWMMKSCNIGGFRGRFFKWDGNFLPSTESFIAPVWVHLPHFPLYLFNEKSILSVASVFGQPLCIDSAALNRVRVGKLSVCIAKDVRVKGPNEIMVESVGDGIMVDRFSQLVLYGEIPDFCNRCCHMGHSIDDCKVVAGLDNPLESRLKGGEVGGIGTVIPIVSIFDRIQKNMQEKDREGGLMLLDRDTVLVEDVYEGDDDISGHSKSDMPKINEQVSNSSTAHSLKHSISVPGSVDHGFMSGASCMMPEVDNKANKTVESDQEAHGNMGATLADSLDKNTNSDSFTDPLLEASNSIPVAAEQGLLVGASNMLSKDEFKADNVVEEGGEVHILAAEKSADDTQAAESAADSVREATLQEDISQLKQYIQVLPSAIDSIHGTLQVAEESLAISQKGCSENEFENRKLMQSAAESVEEATLRGHISTYRDFQPVLLGVPESPIEYLQSDADLDLIAHASEEISDSENGGSSENAADSSTLNEHNFCSERDTGMILDVQEFQEDNIFETPILDINATTGSVFVWLAKKVFERVRDRLYPPDFRGISLEFAQQVLEKVCIIQGAYLSHADPLDKGVKQVQNMLVNKLSPRKVVITHPITREVINLASPSRSQSSMSSQASTIPVFSKTQQNQIKKTRKKAKKQRLAEKKIAKLADMTTPQLKELAKKIIPERSYEKVLCKVNLQDWSGLDSNRSKDSAFWRNYHGAVRDMGDEDYPFMFRSDDSEEVDIESATPKRYYEPP